jgi:DNA-binding NarL/FixJ family response regulator
MGMKGGRMHTAAMKSSDKSQRPPREKEKIRVWLVEDNRTFRQALARVMARATDMECTGSFTSSEDAIEAIPKGDPPDVILLDVNLPGMSGLDALKVFKSHAPQAAVVILTMFDDQEKIYQSVSAGASGYLLKTATPDSILGSIRDVHAGGAPMNPKVARAVMDMFAKMAGPREENNLTDRERDVLKLMTEGLATKQIASRLELSYHTIDTHLRNIYAKLHVHNRSEAVARALRDRMF